MQTSAGVSVNLNLNNARNDSGAVARSPAMAARTTPPKHVMLAVRSWWEMQMHTDAHLGLGRGGAGLGLQAVHEAEKESADCQGSQWTPDKTAAANLEQPSVARAQEA
jgi:hypothetical protein